VQEQVPVQEPNQNVLHQLTRSVSFVRRRPSTPLRAPQERGHRRCVPVSSSLHSPPLPFLSRSQRQVQEPGQGQDRSTLAAKYRSVFVRLSAPFVAFAVLRSSVTLSAIFRLLRSASLHYPRSLPLSASTPRRQQVAETSSRTRSRARSSTSTLVVLADRVTAAVSLS